jgi:hypothetical protein
MKNLLQAFGLELNEVEKNLDESTKRGLKKYREEEAEDLLRILKLIDEWPKRTGRYLGWGEFERKVGPEEHRKKPFNTYRIVGTPPLETLRGIDLGWGSLELNFWNSRESWYLVERGLVRLEDSTEYDPVLLVPKDVYLIITERGRKLLKGLVKNLEEG